MRCKILKDPRNLTSSSLVWTLRSDVLGRQENFLSFGELHLEAAFCCSTWPGNPMRASYYAWPLRVRFACV
jgi:hypothetical protein